MLRGKAEIRTARREGHQIVLVGVFVRFFEPLNRPVRSAEDADLPRSLILVQYLNDWTDWYAWIVAVQEINIDKIEAKTRERVVQVSLNVERRHARAVFVQMRPFANQHDLIADTALPNPAPDRAFNIAAPVDVRRIERVAALREDRIEQCERLVKPI